MNPLHDGYHFNGECSESEHLEGCPEFVPKKTFKASELEDKLQSERPDGLVILTPEDAETIAATVKHLRSQIDKLKGKEEK